jgi:hypothetical protein
MWSNFTIPGTGGMKVILMSLIYISIVYLWVCENINMYKMPFKNTRASERTLTTDYSIIEENRCSYSVYV